jgi:hypothetical protein
MTVTIYIAIGILASLYTLMNMATQDWFVPSLREYWLHYIFMLVSVVIGWPVWFVMGFITYIMEVMPRKKR